MGGILPAGPPFPSPSPVDGDESEGIAADPPGVPGSMGVPGVLAVGGAPGVPVSAGVPGVEATTGVEAVLGVIGGTE